MSTGAETEPPARGRGRLLGCRRAAGHGQRCDGRRCDDRPGRDERRPGGRPAGCRRAAAGPAVGAAGAAGDGLAAGRAAVAARGPVHAGADASGVGAAGGAAPLSRPALHPRPVAERPAAGAAAGAHALVGGRRGDSGGGRLRRSPADLSLPADHRAARPGVLHPVRVLDRPPRVAADPAGAGGVRWHPPTAPLRQPRLLPGRRERGAAVHGGPADGRSGRVLGRRGGRGGHGAPAARGVRGAHLRRPGRPAHRPAVGAAGRPGSRDQPARAVHQPVGLQ